MTAGWARLGVRVPLHHPVTSEEPIGAYRWEGFPASASQARKYDGEVPPLASQFSLTGRCLPLRLPIVDGKAEP
jgi:hypothetical protein